MSYYSDLEVMRRWIAIYSEAVAQAQKDVADHPNWEAAHTQLAGAEATLCDAVAAYEAEKARQLAAK